MITAAAAENATAWQESEGEGEGARGQAAPLTTLPRQGLRGCADVPGYRKTPENGKVRKLMV